MPGSSVRTKKVASQVQQELATILRQDINDPRVQALGIITVCHVDLSADHHNATVFVSFMGENTGRKESKAAISALTNVSGYVRNLLMKRMKTRVVPHLSFKYDGSFDYAAKVHEAFSRIDTSSSASSAIRDEEE